MIKSLVKHFTHQNVPEVRGPITIVQGSELHCPVAFLCFIGVLRVLFLFSCLSGDVFR